jgi:hypothetical protein
MVKNFNFYSNNKVKNTPYTFIINHNIIYACIHPYIDIDINHDDDLVSST